jgi:hypothetical protein
LEEPVGLQQADDREARHTRDDPDRRIWFTRSACRAGVCHDRPLDRRSAFIQRQHVCDTALPHADRASRRSRTHIKRLRRATGEAPK